MRSDPPPFSNDSPLSPPFYPYPEVPRPIYPAPGEMPRDRLRPHVILFVLTFLSTTFAGIGHYGAFMSALRSGGIPPVLSAASISHDRHARSGHTDSGTVPYEDAAVRHRDCRAHWRTPRAAPCSLLWHEPVDGRSGPD